MRVSPNGYEHPPQQGFFWVASLPGFPLPGSTPDAVCLREEPLEKWHIISWQGHMSFLVPTSASRKVKHSQPLWDGIHTHSQNLQCLFHSILWLLDIYDPDSTAEPKNKYSKVNTSPKDMLFHVGPPQMPDPFGNPEHSCELSEAQQGQQITQSWPIVSQAKSPENWV